MIVTLCDQIVFRKNCYHHRDLHELKSRLTNQIDNVIEHGQKRDSIKQVPESDRRCRRICYRSSTTRASLKNRLETSYRTQNLKKVYKRCWCQLSQTRCVLKLQHVAAHHQTPMFGIFLPLSLLLYCTNKIPPWSIIHYPITPASPYAASLSTPAHFPAKYTPKYKTLAKTPDITEYPARKPPLGS